MTPSGGIALFITFLITCILADIDLWLIYLLITSILIVVIGLIDDKIGLGIKVRVFTQLVACLIMLSMNIYIDNFENIFSLQFKYDFVFAMAFEFYVS